MMTFNIWAEIYVKKGCYWFWGVCVCARAHECVILDNLQSVEDFPLSKLHSLHSLLSCIWNLSTELYCAVGCTMRMQWRHIKQWAFLKSLGLIQTRFLKMGNSRRCLEKREITPHIPQMQMIHIPGPRRR